MKYYINKCFETIDNEDVKVLISEDVANFYILNPVEHYILLLFKDGLTVENAYSLYCRNGYNPKVLQQDFCSFVEQLAVNKILVSYEN